jgi:hypothetical protein
LADNEITMCGYRVLAFAKCTTIMIVELMVMSGLRSSRNKMVWIWYGMAEMAFGVVYVELCDP